MSGTPKFKVKRQRESETVSLRMLLCSFRVIWSIFPQYTFTIHNYSTLMNADYFSEHVWQQARSEIQWHKQPKEEKRQVWTVRYFTSKMPFA